MADIKKKGEITIGMLVDFPPYGTTNAQNQPDGYDADVAKLLAKDWGVKVNIVPVTGPNRIPFLLTNKVDLLVASLADHARARQAGAVLASPTRPPPSCCTGRRRHADQGRRPT